MSWTDAFKGLEYKRKLEQSEQEKRTMTLDSLGITGNSSIFGVNSADEDSVLQLETVQKCLNAITGKLASLPINLHRKDKKGNLERIENDNRVYLLNEQNEHEQSSDDFMKLMLKDYLLHGQAHAYKTIDIIKTIKLNGVERHKEGIAELNHIPAKNLETEVFHNGVKYTGAEYTQTVMLGTPTNQNKNQTTFKPDQLLRVTKDPNNNQYEGVGILTYGKKTFEQAFAERDYIIHLWNNGAVPKSYLTSANSLSKTAVDRLGESFNENFGGIGNSGKMPILEEGLQYKQLTYTPEQMQQSEVTKQTEKRICNLFGVPESMVSSEANKYNNIEQNSIHFYDTTLHSIIETFESAFNRQLLTEEEKRQGYFFRFDTSQLMRTTEKERTETISKQFNDGMISFNEMRSKLDLPTQDKDFFNSSLGKVYKYEDGSFEVPNVDGGTKKTDKGSDSD